MKKVNEDKEFIDKNKAVYEFVNSEGWKIFKQETLETIADIQSIMNVDLEDPINDIKVRKNLAVELTNILKKYETQAYQYEHNTYDEYELSPDEKRGNSHIQTD